jgi:hypothetical protein
MKTLPRKTPHFFIINPINDRRMEKRFESKESVQVRCEETGEIRAGTACDVGQHGLRLEDSQMYQVDDRVQIAFTGRLENIGCFGRVAWSRRSDEGSFYETGVSIDTWHGIVDGGQSWKRIKGDKPHADRRRKAR